MQTTGETAAAYLNLPMLAKRWGIDTSTAWRRWKAGQLPESVCPGVRAWRLEDVEAWEQCRASLHMQMLDLAHDHQNRLREILEKSEGRAFTRGERNVVASLMAELDQFSEYMRRVRARTELSGAKDNDIE